MFPARRPTAEYAEIAEKNFLSPCLLRVLGGCPMPVANFGTAGVPFSAGK